MQGWQQEQRGAALWEASGLCMHPQVHPVRLEDFQMTSNRTSRQFITVKCAKPAAALSAVHR